MPVIRPSGRSRTTDSLKLRLTDLLIKELMGESVNHGPVIFEDPSEPDAINVIVVWDAWRGLSQADRADIIHEGYARYSRDLEQSIHFIDPAKKPETTIVPRLTMSLGMTPKEADEAGLLPFSVFPAASPGDVDPDEVERVMIEAGSIETPGGFKLRLPNLRMAVEVRARLIEEMPEARWSILEEAGPFDDSYDS